MEYIVKYNSYESDKIKPEYSVWCRKKIQRNIQRERGKYMSNEKMISDSPELSRDKVIIRTSIIGILANVMLAVFKAIIGLASNSIAVILDAVNNLSDALSSIITIVGTKLAGKLPDKKHPLGYGRIEYLSAMIVSGIVLYAGITCHFSDHYCCCGRS